MHKKQNQGFTVLEVLASVLLLGMLTSALYVVSIDDDLANLQEAEQEAQRISNQRALEVLNNVTPVATVMPTPFDRFIDADNDGTPDPNNYTTTVNANGNVITSYTPVIGNPLRLGRQRQVSSFIEGPTFSSARRCLLYLEGACAPPATP